MASPSGRWIRSSRRATAEDSIIATLEWFRLTEETSERQWDDVSKLVRLHGGAIDLDYLHTMADSIGVRDLLERLLAGGSASRGNE